MSEFERTLLGALLTTLGVLTYRALPPAAWLLVSPSSSIKRRCIGAASVAVLCLVATYFTTIDLPAVALGYAYLIALGSLVPLVADALGAGRISTAGVFAVCGVAFLVLPSVYSLRACNAGLLLLGWDMMLSAYSYCVEQARSRHGVERYFARVPDCLFFLLVNPVLVYTQRGVITSTAGRGKRNLYRIAAGIVTLLILFGLVQPAHGWVATDALSVAQSNSAAVPAAVATGAALVTSAVLRLFMEYLVQSGVADLQIGMVRQLGHDVPDRFNRPWRATGPLDFWRRWNTYVGAWVQRYVFWPSSVRLGRFAPVLRGPAGASVAVLLSFGVIGLLHDVVPYYKDFNGHFRGIFAFLGAGVVVILAHGAAQLPARIASSSVRSALGFGVARLSLVAFWGSTLFLYFWWGK